MTPNSCSACPCNRPSCLQVCELVRQGYSDAFLTAHFEVPGEMFTLAMQVWGVGGWSMHVIRASFVAQPDSHKLTLCRQTVSSELALVCSSSAPFNRPPHFHTLDLTATWSQAKRRGMGVVGSTSNILDFISSKV